MAGRVPSVRRPAGGAGWSAWWGPVSVHGCGGPWGAAWGAWRMRRRYRRAGRLVRVEVDPQALTEEPLF